MASASVLALFRALAPEFSATADATVEALIDIRILSINSTAFGARTSEAVALLVAHELTMQARAAASSTGALGVGALTSVRAGDLSLSYGAPSSVSLSHEDDALRQTHHGLAYLAIRDSRSTTGFGLLT
jgi:hypothetical protein